MRQTRLRSFCDPAWRHVLASGRLALLGIVLLPVAVSAQTGSEENYSAEELRSHFQNVAEAYDMRMGNTELSLREQPLMHWQNTVRKQEQGALYMWNNDGRPQVLGSIFTYQFQNRVHCRHELISLADRSLTSKATNAGVIDGAVFSFAVVTDPEILLVVEARESNGESGSWHYAAARAHYEELALKRKGSVVWQAARAKEMANTRFAQLPYAAEPYFVFFPPHPLPPPEALR